ncbi:MerR family transcriptional regulator [Cohnella endophytica]|uniref:MerR family transcriptional regulator n=1 Tax=Cohnella endophytica TaxID=2419778 RepID=A0A494XF11_9BACL|nr:MerR family transcriptional regulator [Cohnella endophytica]RKP46739.1 MerR family transcriptional regulator [Cohnella endophytica]
MKIKEVCERTGLTERTIRYYVEEELISPRSNVVNGREYRDYSERDIAELNAIADMRKLFFTIDEIKTMKRSPDQIAEVLEKYRAKTNEDVQAKTAILLALERLDLSNAMDMEALARKLKDVSANLALPQHDISPPSFGKFDGESKEEREEEYERYLKRQERRYKVGKGIVFAIAAINVAAAIFSAVINLALFSLIVQIAISIALFAGVTWVRYVFIFGAALSTLSGFSLLMQWGEYSLPSAVAVLIVGMMVYSVVSCVLLLRSEAVKEFLYTQKYS